MHQFIFFCLRWLQPYFEDRNNLGSGARTGIRHYEHFAGDVAYMAASGVRHYRLSLSWPRLMNADLSANETGYAFYESVLGELAKNGITAGPDTASPLQLAPDCLLIVYRSTRTRYRGFLSGIIHVPFSTQLPAFTSVACWAGPGILFSAQVLNVSRDTGVEWLVLETTHLGGNEWPGPG